MFASRSRMGPVAEGNTPVEQQDSGSSIIGSILKGAAIGGAAAAFFYYKANPAARLTVAKKLAGIFNAEVSSVNRAGQGIFKEPLVGSAQDVVVLAKALDFLPKDKALEALNELRRVSAPRFTGSEAHATVQDLLGHLGSTDKKHADILSDALSRLEKATGVSKAEIASQTHLGENVIMEGGQIADYRRWTLEGLAQRGLEYSHENFKFPIIGFSPTDIFLHHSWSHTRQAAILGPAAALRGQRLEQQALVVGRKAFTQGGQVLEGDWKLFSTRSTMAESAAIVSGQYDEKFLHEFVDQSAQGPFAKWFMEQQRKIKNAQIGEEQLAAYHAKLDEIEAKWAKARAEKSRDYSLHQYISDIKTVNDDYGNAGFWGEGFLISPKHATGKAEVTKLMEWMERVHSGVPELKLDVEGKPLRDLEKDPLSWMEELRLRAKGDVRGYHYKVPSGYSESTDAAEAYIIGKGAHGPKKPGGFQEYIPGVHDPDDIVKTFDNFRENPKVPADFIVAEGGEFGSQASRAFWHFQARRPQKLLESLTGFGIRPDPSVLKTLLQGTVGVYAAFEIVKNSMLYFNFLTQGLAAKAVGTAVAGVQMGGQALFTATGIGPASSTAEDYFPGSVNSFGSQLLRVFAAPFIGAYLGGKYLKAMNVPKFVSSILPAHAKDQSMSGAAIGAFAASALAVATVLLDPTKGMAEQYQEITGEKRVAVRNARWWVAGRQPYSGDYIKYYDQSAVQKLWHTGASDKTTYGSEAAAWSHSWFPTPSNLFGIVPLVNPYYVENQNPDYRPYPVVDSAGGNIPVFGPLVQATVGEIAKPRIVHDIEGSDRTRGRYGEESVYEGARLGFENTVEQPDSRSPGGISSILHHTIGKTQDFTGMYGFATKFLTKPLFGSDTGFGGGYELEGSSRMTHQGEALREMNLGGFMGNTEYLRRIYGDRDRSINYYNPMPNAMPEWLPGQGSIFREDTNFNVDFHTGDPYTKIEHGTTRLPGPGYQAAYGYHGGDTPDVLDVWSILSDVAPGSQARKYYEKAVEDMYHKGQLDPEGQRQYERVREEAEARLGGRYQFTDYVNSVNAEPGPAGQASTQYLSYLNKSMEDRPTNPVIAPAQHVWDAVTHTRIPGLAWAQGKFMHNRTPLEEYQATMVHGTPFANWEDPYGGFIKPAYSEVMGSMLGSKYRPSEVQSRDELEEYYDKLKYLKARRLERLAYETGNVDLAHQYRTEQQQTVVGMDYGIGALNRNLFAALPSNARPFVAGFAQAAPSEQQKILDYLPGYQKALWQNIWAKNSGGEVQYNSQEDADRNVAEYFSSHALPAKESQIWNPDVSLDEFKLKTAEHEGVNYWSLGISEAKAREYRSLGRSDVLIDSSPFMQDMELRKNLYSELGRSTEPAGIVNMSNIRQTQEVRYNRRKDFQRQDQQLAGRF